MEDATTISELLQILRDYINSPRKQYHLLKDEAYWNMLCSCMDAVEDTEMALDAYFNLAQPKQLGERYLLIYGVLQTLFLQQDAIKNLYDALDLPYSPDPFLKEIREIRNNTAGHPTKRGGGKGTAYNFIAQHSVSKDGFEFMTTFSSGKSPIFKHVDLPKLIKAQRVALRDVLECVIQQLRKEEMEHRQKFKDLKLQDALPGTLGYHISKVFEVVFGNKPPEFGLANLKMLTIAVNDFKDRLKRRGEDGVYDSVEYVLGWLDYSIEELKKAFTDTNESRLNDKDMYIFASFLREQFDELKIYAREIDEKYESDP